MKKKIILGLGFISALALAQFFPIRTGRVPFGNTNRTLDSSANFFWDNTNSRLGIGTSSPQYTVDIQGDLRVTGSTTFGASNIAIGTGISGSTNNAALYVSSSGKLANEAQLALTRGGTNKSLTAVNGAIAYSDADSLELSAAGSSGQILRSGGASSPTWSTATYPATAGSSGNILVSGGTNFTASTINLASANAVGTSILGSSTGGSGIANSGTFTWGANNITVATGGVTSVTWPTSGTFSTLDGTEAFTNKTIGNTNAVTVKASNLTIQDSSDVTKQAKFAASTISAGTTRTFTFPDATGVLALNPMTAGGDIIYGGASGVPTKLTNGSSGQYLKSVGGTSAPAWQSFTAPTIQKFTSSTGTYTTPANVLYIRVRLIGGGGGGGGSATGAGANGGTGGTGGISFFRVGASPDLLVGNGGVGGGANSNVGGTGGTASLGSGPIGTAVTGGGGAGGDNHTAATGVWAGGAGASGPWGGQGKSNGAGVSNTGAGGGGAEGPSLGYPGSGGGAGGYVDAIISSPGASYSYQVGAAGTAGSAGTGGSVGGAGASGYIEVTEYFQ